MHAPPAQKSAPGFATNERQAQREAGSSRERGTGPVLTQAEPCALKRYKVTVKCYGWLLSSCVVDAENEGQAYYHAKHLHEAHAARIGDAGFYVEPWSCEEVTP